MIVFAVAAVQWALRYLGLGLGQNVFWPAWSAPGASDA